MPAIALLLTLGAHMRNKGYIQYLVWVCVCACVRTCMCVCLQLFSHYRHQTGS